MSKYHINLPSLFIALVQGFVEDSILLTYMTISYLLYYGFVDILATVI